MAILDNINTHELLDALTETVIIIDNKGLIQSINSSGEKLFGYTAEELTGKNISQLMQESDATQHDHFLQQYRSTGNSFFIGKNTERQLQAKTKSGKTIPIDIKVTEFNHNLQHYFIGTIRDQSALVSAHAKLQQSLENSKSIHYTLDAGRDQVTTRWISSNLTQLLGYHLEEAYKNDWWLKHIHPNDKEHALQNMTRLFTDGSLEHEYRFMKKNGEFIWINDRLEMQFDEHGDPFRIFGTWSDISNHRHLESAMLKSEERLRRSQQYANIGTWDLNLRTSELYWSDRIAPLFGYPEGELDTTYENFVQAIHPDDRDMVKNAVTECINNGTEYNIEHRVIWPDGSVHWVQEKGAVSYQDDMPMHMLGVVSDINDRKQLELQKQQQQQLLNMLHDALTSFTVNADYKNTSSQLLNGLLALTHSEFGYVAEVLYNKNGPYLSPHAMSVPVWNSDLSDRYQNDTNTGLAFDNMKTLFGQSIVSRQPIISNDIHTDPRAHGTPEGHPPINSFLGIPIDNGSEIIGMYGLANRTEGYDEELVEFLKPFTSTYASIILAKQSLENEAKNKELLIQARNEAETANIAKSAFLSSMSHELRTPLNAILGFTQLLSMQQNQNEQSLSNLNDINLAGNHLLDLINQVLDLAKIEAGNINLDIENVPLTEVMQICESMVLPLAERNNVKLIIDCHCRDEILVRADYVKLKQVIINLLSNAIKYNIDGGEVHINCDTIDADMAIINISDTGTGISEDQVINLFQHFNRLGIENKSDVEGTGIGLSISKKLIEAMNGLIGYQKEDNGSCFWIKIPLADEGKSAINTPTQTLTAEDELVPEMQTPAKENASIVYIEDNLSNLKLVTEVLKAHTSYTLYSATSPMDGIALIKNHCPDIILLDINLPGMSGYEILDHLKANNICPQAKIIAVTANAMQTDKEMIQESSFDEFIFKPINIQAFLASLKKHLS